MPQKKSTPLLLASITAERWFCGVHVRSRSSVKAPCFQGLYAINQLQKIGQQVMVLKLTTGVRDQKAAGSNPATSTRVKPLIYQGFFYLDRYAVLTFEGSFLLKIGVLSQMCHKAPEQAARNPLILRGLRVFALPQRCHRRGRNRLIWGHLSEQQGSQCGSQVSSLSAGKNISSIAALAASISSFCV